MNKEIRSTLSKEGTLTLGVIETSIPSPAAHEVVVEIHAAPINPSDVGVLFGLSNMISIDLIGTTTDPKVIKYPEGIVNHMKGRWDKPLPSGNEGSGIVVEAGSDMQHLKGKVVSLFGANCFAKYRCVPGQSCMVMNEGTTPEQAAASCVNPYTALGMVATMKMENHTAIINTAAASNLGQMLLKVCKADGIPLINIVRKKEQVDLLKSIGGEYILNSSDNDFKAKLIDAITVTGATLAFECIGGGDMAGQILDAMEKALASKADNYSVYGTTTLKQIYIYGSLNQAPTTFSRSFGLYWNIGGWLVSPIIQKLGVEGFMTMQKRVADEIHTTFKSNFHKSISLEQVCEPDHILEYVKAGSGKKYLVKPQLS
tara:strand:+ start:172 stop:1284 length:1113 start_codon:yes stop_codon:yes gene_type:complete